MADIYFVRDADYWRFRSIHWVDTPIANDRHLINITGVVIVDYKGVTSDAWRHDTIHLVMPFPGNILPPKKVLHLDYWAPFVTVNALYNKDNSVNAGWAVDEFRLDVPPDGKISVIHIVADVAVRDSDGYLYRVGYTVTLSGSFVDPPPFH